MLEFGDVVLYDEAYCTVRSVDGQKVRLMRWYHGWMDDSWEEMVVDITAIKYWHDKQWKEAT